MKKIIYLFILLLMAIGLGFLMHLDSGYVLIGFHKWTLEMSFWTMIFGLIILLIVLQVVLHIIRKLTGMNYRLRTWGGARSQTKAHKQTHLGLFELAEGRWKKAEDLLIKSAQAGTYPFVSYLSAAKAAQEQQAYDRRDEYLKAAHNTPRVSEVAIGLTQAQLQIEAAQWEQAIATLQHLNQQDPNHVYVLKLMAQVYEQLADWAALDEILPSLKSARASSKERLHQLEERVYLHRLSQPDLSLDDVHALWLAMPRAFHIRSALVAAYVHHIGHTEVKLSIQLITTALNKNWDGSLLQLFSQVAAHLEDPNSAYMQAVKWQQKQPQEPELLLCLGRLSIAQKIWGQAKQHLQQCEAVMPRPDVYQELGFVLDQLGEKEQAIACYRKGLDLFDHNAGAIVTTL